MHDQEHGEDEEHADLEQAEDGAQPGRGPDAVVAGREYDQRAEDRPRPPQAGRISVELGVDRGGGGEAELQQHQRRYQPADEHVSPRHEESGGRVDPPGRVGRQRPGGGHLTGQQADAPRAEQARHQGEDHRQWQCSAGEGDPGRNRRGDGGAGRHVRDALEQDLTKTDRISPEPARGLLLSRCRHGCLRYLQSDRYRDDPTPGVPEVAAHVSICPPPGIRRAEPARPGETWPPSSSAERRPLPVCRLAIVAGRMLDGARDPPASRSTASGSRSSRLRWPAAAALRARGPARLPVPRRVP